MNLLGLYRLLLYTLGTLMTMMLKGKSCALQLPKNVDINLHKAYIYNHIVPNCT